MIRRTLLLLASLAVLAVPVAGCGGSGGSSGSGSLGKGVVAVVGTDRITQAQFEEVLREARTNYKLEKKTFPKTGSPAWEQLKGDIMAFLVQRSEITQKAKVMGIRVTEKQIDRTLAQIRKQRFGGSEKKLEAELKRVGQTLALLRDAIRSTLIEQAITKKLSSRLKVSKEEVQAYYRQNLAQYTQPAHTQPASRAVRHILVKSKSLAESIYKQLEGGASFAALVKKYSIDPGSKNTGGKYTDVKGTFVPVFEKVAFSLKTGAISKPVRSENGWHVIQALAPISPPKKIPAKTTPLSQVRETIRQTLRNRKQADAIQRFLAQLKRDFATRLTFATGFEPPATATSTKPAATTVAPPTTTG